MAVITVFRLLLTAVFGFFVLAGATTPQGADADLPPHPIRGDELETGEHDGETWVNDSEHGAKVALGNNANAVLSLDLIAGGGAGNQRDDGVATGTVQGRGTKIAIEIFATGVTTSLHGAIIRFDFDATLVTYVKAANSAFALSIPEGSVGVNLASTAPVNLASSGFLARAEFETAADVTGREFSIGVERVTIAESVTSTDELTTGSVITFNATVSASPDFDGDGTVSLSDFLAFAGSFGSSQGDARYEARFDLDGDGAVALSDFLIFAGAFGSEVPPSGGGGGGNPDLVVQSPSVSNSRVSSGADFTLGATVRNQGNGPSAASTLRYYSSSDATISASDTEVGTDAVGGLAASGASAESIDLTAPSSARTYYYGACVDGVSGESDTGNNCSAAVSITVETPQDTTETWKLYWSEWDFPGGGAAKIRRSNLDGSGVENLVTTGLGAPGGIALDVAGGKMYWTDWETDKIQRANLDGSGVEDLITGLSSPYAIALDVAGGKMYWTDAVADKIQRSNLDGSGVEDLITGLDAPGGIALDVAGGKMYWTDGGDADKIQRSNLDGSGVENLVTSGLDEPEGIALDVAGGKMYWADAGFFDNIQRANLDGSGVEDLVTTGIGDPRSIALDVAGGKMYWTDAGAYKIQRSNLDGSGVEDLITGFNRTLGIALGLVPIESGDNTGGGDPPPAKAVTGTITDCSATYSNFIYAIRITGTVRANRTVTNLTITGFVGGQFVGIRHLGTLSAGQSRSFTVSGISATRPSGGCRLSIEWLEWGSQSRVVVEEH